MKIRDAGTAGLVVPTDPLVERLTQFLAHASVFQVTICLGFVLVKHPGILPDGKVGQKQAHWYIAAGFSSAHRGPRDLERFLVRSAPLFGASVDHAEVGW